MDKILYTADHWRNAFLFTLNLAVTGKTETYGSLAKHIGLPVKGNYTTTVLGQILDAIDDYCRDRRLEPTNGLVVSSVTGIPGHGYFRLHNSLGNYSLSEEIGYTKSQRSSSRTLFWTEQRNNTFNFWTL